MYTVLIVDDERWVRTSLKKVIERTGLPFRVVYETAHGLEALDWLKTNRADVIITDVRMPVMDGLQLVRSLQESTLNSKIIIVSGHDEFQYAQQALRLGVCDYLLKPVMVEELAECLNKVKDWKDKQTDKKTNENFEEPQNVHDLSMIEQVISYIKKNIPGEVTLQDTAAAVHLNPSYLSFLFKQQMRINFIDYVLQLRMEEAQKLLSTTSLRISEIAERLGYHDTSYFSHSFKRMVGQTPSEYRKGLNR